MKKIELVSVALVALMALTVVSGAGVLKVQAAVSLGDALDNTALTWTTGGDAVWFGETTTTHDNVDAAQSGDIGNSQNTWLSTTVTGPGTLTFWWKVSSEGGWDYLRFYINDVAQPRYKISGEQDWVQVKIPIATEGAVTLKWAYTKDGSVTEGDDAGWVDQVTFKHQNVNVRVANLQYNLWNSAYDPLTGLQYKVTYGKITIDTRTGHVVLNMNYGRLSTEQKEYYKELFIEGGPVDIGVYLDNYVLGQEVDLGLIAATNRGGNINGEGTITNEATLLTLAGWLSSDNVYVGLYAPP